MQHQSLEDWRAQLTSRASGPLSLFDLLDGKPDQSTSIRRAWSLKGMDLQQLGYDEASAIIHGNRFFPAGHISSENVIGPSQKVLDGADTAEALLLSTAVLMTARLDSLTEGSFVARRADKSGRS